ncbi:hypothetical protein [Cochleicola gelatinilyticus]|uniref:Uncharacterized protein n=1 Tax=Cochleicola gelatinilyticus TaxID=1763537 RepID=A0A167J5R9_9FLAO|nr:hypothetical protein [Cochleicola gelatinilyticus]OAB80354.1 hypothetical protein ULVI_06360 [Cochleicola gelatinilyticus]
MQLKSIFLLLVFSWCILTPTIVTLCNIDVDLATLFSMNEEENSETFKLSAKEYNTPNSVIPKILLFDFLENKSNFANHDQFWETLALETISPPPEYL